MESHIISSIEIKGLWGRSSYKLKLNDKVNFLIGRNGCGKTTIIALIHSALRVNLSELVKLDFTQLNIGLKDLKSGNYSILNVNISESKMLFELDELKFKVDIDKSGLRGGGIRYGMRMIERFISGDYDLIKDKLAKITPIAWLPVSRRLPLSEEDRIDRRATRSDDVESVDMCLTDLERELQNYCSSLAREHTLLQKKFEQEALKNLLFNKSIDGTFDIKNIPQPTDEDKKNLIHAFDTLGILNGAIKMQIDDHFKASKVALDKINNLGENDGFPINDLFVFPLIRRTQNLVSFAQELEQERLKLYQAIDVFVKICKKFFKDKLVNISPNGLIIVSSLRNADALEWKMLSSGEKQILILLIQALVWSNKPVIYIADEPELSLHVEWQEMLIDSIKALAGDCQLIIATHSPDITGGDTDSIIKISRLEEI